MIERHIIKYGTARRDELEEMCKEWNLVLFIPQGNELFIDLDEGREVNSDALNDLVECYGIPNMLETVSKSGKGKHLYIRLLEDLPVLDRIALQAALGDDGRRAMRSYLQQGGDVPIAFFETPEMAELVNDWRNAAHEQR